jgi:hypothetical protein
MASPIVNRIAGWDRSTAFHHDVQRSVAKSTPAGLPWLRFLCQRTARCVSRFGQVRDPTSFLPGVAMMTGAN